MTKPAAVFLQLVGGILLIVGMVTAFGGTWWPLVVGFILVAWGGYGTMQRLKRG